MSDPTITAAILKNGHSELLKDVSIKTIQYRFQKDLCLPTLRVTVKPLLTKNIKKDKKKARSIDARFYPSARLWFWVMNALSDRRSYKVRASAQRCCAVIRYTQSRQLNMRIVWWDSFFVDKGRRGLYLLLKNVAASGGDYINVLSEHLPDLRGIHEYDYFMPGNAPYHQSDTL